MRGDTYTILPTGEQYVSTLRTLDIGMDKYKTSLMSKALKAVYRCEMPIIDAVKIAEDCVREIFDKDLSCSAINMNYIGKCPICGEDVVKNTC